jgi:hypothetical protein
MTDEEISRTAAIIVALGDQRDSAQEDARRLRLALEGIASPLARLSAYSCEESSDYQSGWRDAIKETSEAARRALDRTSVPLFPAQVDAALAGVDTALPQPPSGGEG